MTQTTEYRPLYRTCGEKEKAALAKIKLVPHKAFDVDDLNGAQKQMCIMQTLAYVTGQATTGEIKTKWDDDLDGFKVKEGVIQVTDQPICASAVITNLCIDINDAHNENDATHMRRLAKLKAALPAIQGTAPIREKIVTRHLKSGPRVTVTQETDMANPAYRAAEKKREEMISAAQSGEGPWGAPVSLGDNWLVDPEVPMTKKVAFIEELANVAKFNYPQEA